MTLSFNPCFIGLASATLLFFVHGPLQPFRFNPCFIGLASATGRIAPFQRHQLGFNPCFIGLASATFPHQYYLSLVAIVSILVLLD